MTYQVGLYLAVEISHYTHDSGLAGLGSGGVTGKPDVEKRQLVGELQ